MEPVVSRTHQAAVERRHHHIRKLLGVVDVLFGGALTCLTIMTAAGIPAAVRGAAGEPEDLYLLIIGGLIALGAGCAHCCSGLPSSVGRT